MDYQLLVDSAPEIDGMFSHNISHYSALFKPEHMGNVVPFGNPIRPLGRFSTIPSQHMHNSSHLVGHRQSEDEDESGINDSIGSYSTNNSYRSNFSNAMEMREMKMEGADEDISHERQLIIELMINGSTQREAARKLQISLNKLKACCKMMQINIWPGKLIRLTEEVGKFLRNLRASGDHLYDDKAKKMLSIIDDVDHAKLRCKSSAGSYRRVLCALEKAALAKKTLELMRDRRNKRNHLERKVFRSLAIGPTCRSAKNEDPPPMITALWSRDDIDLY